MTGEVAELMLDGALCEGCGGFIDGLAPGHPRYCSKDCEPVPETKGESRANRRRAAALKDSPRTFMCPSCPKGFRCAEAVDQHIRDKHGAAA